MPLNGSSARRTRIEKLVISMSPDDVSIMQITATDYEGNVDRKNVKPDDRAEEIGQAVFRLTGEYRILSAAASAAIEQLMVGESDGKSVAVHFSDTIRKHIPLSAM